MEYRKVDGVLKYNIETRNNMLIKNMGKYSQYDELLSPEVGSVYHQRMLNPTSLTNGKALLDYTHDGKNTYSEKINQKYFLTNREKNVYEIFSDKGNFSPEWQEKYNDYLHYASDVYGKELTAINFVERILSKQDIVYGLRMMNIGVVKDISVSLALAGVVTTNVNNFSGTDTKLGLITNSMYANSLYAASEFNTSRKRGDKNSEYPYITPSLYKFYGNNSANVNNLSDIMRPNRVTGRITEDPAADINIQRDWNNINILGDNSSVKYLLSQVKTNKYHPYTHNEYITPYEFNGRFYTSEAVTNLDSPKDLYYDTTINSKTKKYKEYDEGDNAVDDASQIVDLGEYNRQGYEYGTFETEENSTNTLLDKTNKLFRSHKINSLSARFHTSKEYNEKYKNESFDSAKSSFGNSKGRNLLKLGAASSNFTTNNYSNPYCRVWTYHHQYDRLTRLIRPFVTEENGIETSYSLNDLQKLNENFRARNIENNTDGWDYLSEKTVLNKDNGFINIAPSNSGNVSIKQCMFSLENLAWKDVPNMAKYLSEEQRGPFGGRIMWFPPYGLTFNESVNVEWNNNTFIGRGEKIYTYSNTDRRATLNFTLLIDYPAIINEIRNMKGKDPDDNIEMDTLRFFAGCGPLDNDKKSGATITSTEENKSVENSTEPEQEINEEKVEKLKFYVFFPNNYSGNYNEGKVMTESEWREKGSADSWAAYLLYGNNTETPSEEEKYVGYEMGNGEGISDKTTNGITTAVDPTTNLSKNWTVFPDYTGSDKEQRIYHYKVDFDLRQKLRYIGNDGEPNNYYDSADYGLNINIKNVCNYYPDATCSFAEFIAAMFLNRHRKNGEYNYDEYYSDTTDTNLRYLIEKISKSYSIEESEAFEVVSEIEEKIAKGVADISVIGGATEQDKINQNLLAHRRCRALGSYIKNVLSYEGNIDFSQIEDTCELLDKTTINSQSAKAQRYASIEITFGKANKAAAGDIAQSNGIVDTQNSGNVSNDSESTTAETQEKHSVVGNSNTRYESEADYFDKLKITDPLIFKKITDKFRYFNPAYHSISPEGFNARLTFLHQCTRQGHTVGVDTGNAKTGGNLSFGRMPVCVLRIGDFLYSKVLIESMSISYDSGNGGMQWDLNPEGSGVQPMYANISLSLILLGGQTLDGPADRLQNANTFNYYANTGVYDDRADRISVDSNGKLTYNNIFIPYNNEKTNGNNVENKTK